MLVVDRASLFELHRSGTVLYVAPMELPIFFLTRSTNISLLAELEEEHEKINCRNEYDS